MYHSLQTPVLKTWFNYRHNSAFYLGVSNSFFFHIHNFMPIFLLLPLQERMAAIMKAEADARRKAVEQAHRARKERALTLKRQKDSEEYEKEMKRRQEGMVVLHSKQLM